MSSIVVALPNIEDAKKIRAILVRHGFPVAAVCNTASNALAGVSELGHGVLICGYRLADMNYQELLEYLPCVWQPGWMESNGNCSPQRLPTGLM